MVNTVLSGEGRILLAVPTRTKKPFVEELPRLLEERGMSLRGLGREAGVSGAYLSSLLRGVARTKAPSADLVRRVAHALDLPPDYFVEYREAVVVERIRSDPRLRDELYDRLHIRRRR